MLLRTILVLTLAVPSLASAQYYNVLNGQRFSNIYAANADFLMSQMIQNAGMQSLIASSKKRQAANVQQPAAPVAVKKANWQFPLTATDFKPAGKRTTAEQLASAAQTPEDKKALIDMCRQIQTAIEAQPEVRKNNLATALTLLLGASIQTVAQRELDDAESEELLRTVNDVLAGTPGLKTMTAAQKTAAYDGFLITGGLIAGLAEEGKNNPELATIANQLATQTLAQFGVK